jgi:hypothetical protein
MNIIVGMWVLKKLSKFVFSGPQTQKVSTFSRSSKCFFRSKVRHENIYYAIYVGMCWGPLPHEKNHRSAFWENPFLGTVPTAFKTLFFTNFLQRADSVVFKLFGTLFTQWAMGTKFPFHILISPNNFVSQMFLMKICEKMDDLKICCRALNEEESEFQSLSWNPWLLQSSL